MLLCPFTGIFMKKESQRSPAILILLVTCLIVALMVVVGFFGIKLKRAHFAWRRGKYSTLPFFVLKNTFSLTIMCVLHKTRSKKKKKTSFLMYSYKKYLTVFFVTENEDSNPSEESNKSKSTQEDKNFQGQRHKGRQLISSFYFVFLTQNNLFK